MYKNILIISDNLSMCREFERVIIQTNLGHLKWSFAITKYSSLELYSKALFHSVEQVDLKSQDQVDIICEKYDLVFSLHCKQLFSAKLVSTVKCINVHPGYNPINRGWYPQVFSIFYDLVAGATIHEMDAELDNGDIIAREMVKSEGWDTSNSLYDKILRTEIKLLETNLKNIVFGDYTAEKPENSGNIFYKSDFSELCILKLNEIQSVKQTINHLRALSHGSFKNAYFIDEQTGKKVFVTIELKVEE